MSMSQREDSNPRPADYKSAALPTELLWPDAVVFLIKNDRGTEPPGALRPKKRIYFKTRCLCQAIFQLFSTFYQPAMGGYI